jgi:hypothetical protein
VLVHLPLLALQLGQRDDGDQGGCLVEPVIGYDQNGPAITSLLTPDRVVEGRPSRNPTV